MIEDGGDTYASNHDFDAHTTNAPQPELGPIDSVLSALDYNFEKVTDEAAIALETAMELVIRQNQLSAFDVRELTQIQRSLSQTVTEVGGILTRVSVELKSPYDLAAEYFSLLRECGVEFDLDNRGEV